MRLQESFQIFKAKWLANTTRQKMGVATLVFLLLALPLSVGAVLTRQYLGSRASIPVTPPITAPTVVPTTTATPNLSKCNEFCTTDSQCDNELSCLGKSPNESLGRCRDSKCPNETDCACGVQTASPSATPKPTRTPTPKPTTSASPTARPTPVNNSVSWKTQYVELFASNFYINIDGNNLFVSNPQIQLSSDPGNKDYTTLEAIWQENNVEMRLNIYFNRDSKGNWTAYEIRTYNGQFPGDWLYYNALPSRPVGTQFIQSNLNLFSTDGRGTIHFENIRLLPFFSYIPSPTPTPIANRAPVISTSMLNIARRNRNYNMTISGYDRDVENILSLKVTGLPNGITQRNCNQTYLQNSRGVDSTAITCRYAGITTKRGVYSLRAVLRDNQGGVRVKTLFLLVW